MTRLPVIFALLTLAGTARAENEAAEARGR